MKTRKTISVSRLTSAGLGVLLFCSCTLPGMKMGENGSELWDQSNALWQPKITHITPALVINLKHAGKQQKAAQQTAQQKIAKYDYRVGVGDLLSVIVWEHPELTNPTGEFRSENSAGRLVHADGTLFFPHVGVLKVDGMTVSEIRQVISTRLARVIQDPQVDVRVIEYRSQQAFVVGDVEKPCRIPISDKPVTVLDALDGCQTIRPSVSNRSITLIRNTETYEINTQALYSGHHSALSLTVENGDLIKIGDDRWNKVFVVGEVERQVALTIPVGGITLAEALVAQAPTTNDLGGLNVDSVDAEEIYVIRGISMPGESASSPQLVVPEIYQLNAKSPDALLLADQFKLHPRDVIFASTTGSVRFNRGVSQIIPSLQTLIQAAILADRN